MKICFVTNVYPPSSNGGTGEVVYNLQQYFLNRGIDAYVFTCGAHDRKYLNTIRTPGGKRLFFPSSPFYYFKALRKFQFDILNLQQESGMFIAPFLLSNEKHAVVTTLHAEYLNESKVTRPLTFNGSVIAKPSFDERLSKHFMVPIKLVGTYLDMVVSDSIIAVSEKTKEYYLIQRQIPRAKIKVIYNGVDSEKFNPQISGEAIRKKYSLGNSPLILAVGSSRILKGIVFLFYSLREIIKVCPNVKLLIVGVNSKYKKQVLPIIRRLGVQNSIVMVEYVPNNELPYYYASSDLVVLPSLMENFPVVALEAMSSGKPIVASRVGGIPEVVKDNENGILVEPANVDQMVDALLCLLGNSSMRNKMGIAGRKMVEEKFDWKKIGWEYLKEFEKLV
jgi:glycosyltransferase involved in cell wall biosynthesis